MRLSWFQVTRTMQGERAPRLAKYTVGEYNPGYFEDRTIGRISVAGETFAYELDTDRQYTSLEVAAEGVIRYLGGFDREESQALTERVDAAIAENQRSLDVAVNWLLNGGLLK
jgi:hypothetical protein